MSDLDGKIRISGEYEFRINDSGHEVGKFFVKDGQFHFEGDAAESALQFFEMIRYLQDDYVRGLENNLFDATEKIASFVAEKNDLLMAIKQLLEEDD